MDPVLGEIKERLDEALEYQSGILGIVCSGAIEDPPFIQAQVVVNRKAGAGEPEQEVFSTIEFERRDGEWVGSPMFFWTKTTRQEALESAAAAATREAAQAPLRATQEARRNNLADQPRTVTVRAAALEWNGTHQRGLPMFRLQLQIDNSSGATADFDVEAIIRLSDGSEHLYQNNDCCASSESAGQGVTQVRSDIGARDVPDTTQPYQTEVIEPLAQGASIVQVTLVFSRIGVTGSVYRP
jgi:hypothetical protein